MIITTTPAIEGKHIRDYRGIVTGETILGANIFRDLFAGIGDIVGGRSAGYEKELRNAREMAMAERPRAQPNWERTPSWELISITKYSARITVC